MKSVLAAGLIVGGKESKEGRQTVLFTPLDPWRDEAEEEFNNDSPRPRQVHFKSKWMPHQDAVYWIHVARAQEKELRFWQTVSRHCCLRVSVGRLHRKSGIRASSEGSFQKCLEIKAPAATAAAGHIEEHRETGSGAEPRHPKERETLNCMSWEKFPRPFHAKRA